MSEIDGSTLDGFLDGYGGTNRELVVLDLDVEKISPGDGRMIVVRSGRHAVVICPMRIKVAPSDGYLDVDVHPFIDGKAADAEAIGWGDGMRDRVDMADKELVAVLVGRKVEKP